jgi:hypothetical protein
LTLGLDGMADDLSRTAKFCKTMQFEIWRHNAMHVKSDILSCHAVERFREGLAVRGLLIWINKTLIPDLDAPRLAGHGGSPGYS